MEKLKQFSRYFVGIIFLISGFVKAVDPIGTAYKMEEYFLVFAENFGSFFQAFVPFALLISIFFIVLELVMAVALLIGYRMKITAWVYLIIILYFSFLTFYSAYTGEVSDCGCFGNAMPLTPWQSFSKDMVLLVFILIIFKYKNEYSSPLDNNKGAIIVALSTLISIGFAKYSVEFLPVIDFLQYKVGNNIKELRNDGKPGKYHYKMSKDGVTKVFETYPTEKGWKYEDMIKVEEPKLPTINDFYLTDAEGNDGATDVLEGTKLLIVTQKINKFTLDQAEDFKSVFAQVQIPNLEYIILTGSSFEEVEAFNSNAKFNATIYMIDEVVIKAMIRSNPGLILLKDGVILGKWHHHALPSAEEIMNLAK